MSEFRGGRITAVVGASALGVSDRWFRKLYSSYLEACSKGEEGVWEPGRSGGNRSSAVPEQVSALWRRMLSADPPAPYNFVASESFRRFGFSVDRATVRRWAQAHGLTHPQIRKSDPAPVRRWQCQQVGALWQMDASPHRWLGPQSKKSSMIELVDDCSRVITGAKLYPRECLLAYLDLLPRVFEQYGLPLGLYVDYHSFFFTYIPDNLTYLGWALRYYDISLKYAPTAKAKGKVERHHQFWQNRLPSYCAAETITTLDAANRDLDLLREHHNVHEIHRELRMEPQTAWDRAVNEGRCALRPFQRDPWWPYVWSLRVDVKVDVDGTVPVDTQRLKIPASPFSKVTRCQHPDGSYTFLARPPGEGGKPIVLLRCETTPKWDV